MKILLYVLLGIVLGMVLLVLVVYLWIRSKIRQFSNIVKEAGSGEGAPPMRITLDRTDDPDWENPDEAQKIRQNLESLGYQPIETYEAYAPRFLVLEGFHHPDSGSFAAIYDVYGVGKVLIDLVAEFEDGNHFTCATAPDDGMDRAPWSTMERFPDLDPTSADDLAKIHAAFLQGIAGKQVVRHPAANFSKKFRKSWAREMDWRMSRGGITPEEVRRVAANQGNEEPTDEEVEEIRQPWLDQISEFVSDLIKKQYFKKTEMTGEEWSRTEYRLLVVHEMSTPDSLIHRLTASFLASQPEDDDDELYERTEKELRRRFDGQQDMRAAFHKALELMSGGHAFKKIGSFSKPVKGEIWLEPEYDDDVEDDDLDDDI